MSRRARTRSIVGVVVGIAVIGGLLMAANPFRPSRAVAEPRCQLFRETGHVVCDTFLAYWQAHGGLAQYGFPLSDPFLERNAPPPAGDGQDHMVQYFQRARFEEHLENQPPYDVLLGLLGAEQFGGKYPSGTPQSSQRVVTLNSLSRSAQVSTTTPRQNSYFVVADVTLTNILEEKFDSKSSAFGLITRSGATLKPIAASAQLDPALTEMVLEPGDSTRGLVAFEVGNDDPPIALIYDSYPAKATISITSAP